MIARAVYQPTFHAHMTVTVSWTAALVALDDPCSRDGIGYEGELADARGRVAFRTGNLDPRDHPDHLAFVTALLDAAEASFPGLPAVGEVRRYMR